VNLPESRRLARLGAGDKSSQAKDIDRAISMASELKSAARAKKARKSK